MIENKVLNFRNFIQVVLWETELAGQISDGMWENSGPIDHYKYWSHVRVQVDPSNVGRNFYVRKDNYNFTHPDLLDCVADRMLFKAKLALLYPKVAASILRTGHFPEDREAIRSCEEYAERHDYYKGVLQKYAEAELTQEMLDKVEAFDGFTMKELRNALKDMKTVIKTVF